MKKITILNKLKKVSNFDELQEIIKELELDLIENVKTSKLNVKNYFKKLVDSCTYEHFKGFYQVDGKNVFCDGYRLIEISKENTPLNTIAEKLEIEKEYNNKTTNFYSVLRGLQKEKEINIDMDLLQKIINYNKINKLKYDNFIPYYYENNKGEISGLNPTWLLELLQLNNTDYITIYNSKNAPVTIQSIGISSLVLPLRINLENEKEKEKAKIFENLKSEVQN